MNTLRKKVSKGTLGLWFLFLFVFHFPGQSLAAIDFVQLDPIALEKVYFEDVAVTDYGKVYVIDGWKKKVLVMNYAGDVLGNIGVNMPTAVAIGPDGILYVGSYQDGSVQKIDQNGDVVGALGQGAGEFQCPGSIAVDELGNVYVIDSELQKIKGYDSTGTLMLEIDDTPNLPKDIVVYNNEIFVLDQPKLDDSYGGQYHGARIRVYNMAGNLLRSFGSYGRSTGQFIRVKSITADNQGRILVSDSSLNRIQAFSPAGAYLGVIDGASNAMESPREMTVTEDSRLLIASATASTLYAFGLYNADGSASFLNQNPTADAGLDQIVDEGGPVTLDASNSNDPDGDGLFYQWRQVGGTPVSLSDSSALTPTFAAPLTGPAGDTLTFELTVIDMRGLADGPDICTVDVKNIVSGTIAINGQAAYSNEQTVSLALASEDASQVRLANDDLLFGPWQQFTPALDWLLANGDGPKTVHAEFKDIAGNTASASASIILDTVSPAVPVFSAIAEDSSLIAWSAVPSSTYRLQYADNPFFTNAVTVEPLFNNFYTLPPLDSGKWYWRVLALDQAGNASDWSLVASLTIGGGGSDCPFAPDAPELQKPEYGDEVAVLGAKLKIAPLKGKDWQKQEWMTQWQVCETDTFDQLTLDGVLDSGNSTSFITPHLALLPDFTYNWRVRYVSIDGCTSAWSEISLFDTGLGPADFNMNGIPDDQEVDLSVDLDDNMVADAQQSDIKCVTTLTGGQMGVLVVEPVDALLEAVAAMDEECRDDGKDLPDMTLGLASFRIRVVHPGDSAKLTLYLSEAAHKKARLYWCDPNVGLLDYSDHAEFSADRTSVTMIVEDGGAGDADGTVNQVIVVTAGPGVFFPPPSAMGSAVNLTESIIDITESIINND